MVAIYNQAVRARFQTGDRTEWKVSEQAAWLASHPEDSFPLYVHEVEGQVAGWLSISPYRPGREALRFTAEVSYFVDRAFQGRGVASGLLRYALDQAPSLGLKTLFAIVLDRNEASLGLLQKFGFERWGHLPAWPTLTAKSVATCITGAACEPEALASLDLSFQRLAKEKRPVGFDGAFSVRGGYPTRSRPRDGRRRLVRRRRTSSLLRAFPGSGRCRDGRVRRRAL